MVARRWRRSRSGQKETGGLRPWNPPVSKFERRATSDERLGRKAAAAPAPAGRIRVAEGEARPLHAGHVVDGHASEVLRAEAVDEDAHPVDLGDHVVFQRSFFDVEAV